MIYILGCLNFIISIPMEPSCNIVPFGHEIASLSSLSFVNILLMRVSSIYFIVIKLINNDLCVNPVGLAKTTGLVIMVGSVDFAKPTGLGFTYLTSLSWY